MIPPHTISASVISRSESARATWCGVLPVTPECSLIAPRILKGDVPDPVAEEGPVKGKSTEGSDDEVKEQRPYHCSVHAFECSPPNRHSVEVLMLWGHKAPLCRPSYARYTHWSRPRPLIGQTTGAGAGQLSAAARNPRRRRRLALPQTGAPSLGSGEGDGRRLKEGRTEPDRPSPRLIVVRAAPVLLPPRWRPEPCQTTWRRTAPAEGVKPSRGRRR
jgi:hypothetical protein